MYQQQQPQKSAGFTFVEIIIYIAIIALVVSLVSAVMFYFTRASDQTRGDREITDNARRVLEIITYEVNGAEALYAPTTTTNQLSLQTSRYTPAGEDTAYIDFFVCGTRVCLKKESQSPIFITADSISVTNLTFTTANNNGFTSVKISLSVTDKNSSQPLTLISTASLRNY